MRSAQARAAESTEHLAVDDPETGAGQHGNRQFRYHRHVEGHPVASFETGEIPQKGREFVHADIQFLIRDVLVALFERLRHEMNRRLVLVFGQMTVHAVITGIDLSALEPFVARGIAGIQDLVPVFVPGQQIGVFLEAVREIIQAETVIDFFIGHIGLGDEFRCGIIESFFLPVNGNLSF